MDRKELCDALWTMLRNKVGSYELKNEIVLRGLDAIEARDISKLKGDIVSFKPDDGTVETCEADAAWRIMEADGVVEFVQEQIFEKRLDELVDERFGIPELEEMFKLRARKADLIGDMTPLRMGVNITKDDGSKLSLSGEIIEQMVRESGLWDYIEQKIKE